MNSHKNFSETADNKKQKGASLVEYVLLIALIAVVAIVAMKGLGNQVSSTFSNISSQLGSTN